MSQKGRSSRLCPLAGQGKRVPGRRSAVSRGFRFPLAVLALAFAVSSPTLAVPRWVKIFGGESMEEAYDVRTTHDGGYVVAGYVRSFDSGDEFPGAWLLRLDTLGDTLWTRILRPPVTGYMQARAVVEMEDLGFLVAGFRGTSLDDDTGCFLLWRTDSLGNTLWHKLVSPDLHCVPYDMALSEDGGVVIAGIEQNWKNPEDSLFNGYVMRCDTGGNIVWARSFGGLGSDWFYALDLAPNGDVFVAGEWGMWRDWLLRLDRDGNLLWERMYTTSGARWFQGVCALPDGGVVATGGISRGSTDYYVLRADSAGDTLWTRAFGGSGYDVLWEVCRAHDSGFVCVGKTTSRTGQTQPCLIKLSEGGDVVWSQFFCDETGSEGTDLARAKDGGYVLAGWSAAPQTTYDCLVIKTDDLGSVMISEREPSPATGRFVLEDGGEPLLAGGPAGISYFVPAAGPVRLDLFSAVGRLVLAVDAGWRKAGRHNLDMPADLPSGLYIIRLQAGGRAATCKLVIPR